jgi:predicted phosphoribosyltransferase
MLFADRTEAGRRLAARLGTLRDRDPVVLGLPRGGVVVAFEVAQALGAPLDVVVVRKLGVPSQPELAMGAVGEGGVRLVDPRIVRAAEVTAEELAAVERRERAQVLQRVERFRGGAPPVPLEGRTAVLVDDGVATGATLRAACGITRAQGSARVLAAVPVAAKDALGRLRQEADEVVCLSTPWPFRGVGRWYGDFAQVDDETVVELLERARAGRRSSGNP